MIRSIRARIGWIYAHVCVQGGKNRAERWGPCPVEWWTLSDPS